eukprot:30935-Pelagococcus_subviridis.AAC.11
MYVSAVVIRGDDEAAVQTHVLVPKVEGTRALADEDVVSRLLPRESKLRLPRELSAVEHGIANERVDDVSRVDVDDDQRVDLLPVEVAQIAADHRRELQELPGEFRAEVLHRHLLAVPHAREHVLHLPGPPNLRPDEDPLAPRLLRVEEHALFADLPQRLPHLRLDAQHPNLDGALGGARGAEIKRLALRADHPGDGLVPSSKLQRRAVIVQLEHVLLHGRRVRRAEHGQQLVVGDEEKPRERVALRVEVLGQRLLAQLELLVKLLQERKAVLHRTRHLPVLLDAIESFRLLRELVSDVVRPDEDALQVHPLPLDFVPHLDDFRDEAELRLPRADVVDERLRVPRRHHRLQRERHVVQRDGDLVRAAQGEAAVFLAFDVLQEFELLVLPHVRELHDVGLDLHLLLRGGAHHPEREHVRIRVHARGGDRLELLPVSLAHRLRLQRLDRGQRRAERLDDLGHEREYRRPLQVRPQHRLEPLREVFREVHELREIQILPHRGGEPGDAVHVRDVQTVNLVEHLELVLRLRELGVGRHVELEQLLRHDEVVSRLELERELFVVRRERGDAHVELRPGHPRAALLESLSKVRALLFELLHVVDRHERELVPDFVQVVVHLFAVFPQRRPYVANRVVIGHGRLLHGKVVQLPRPDAFFKVEDADEVVDVRGLRSESSVLVRDVAADLADALDVRPVHLRSERLHPGQALFPERLPERAADDARVVNLQLLRRFEQLVGHLLVLRELALVRHAVRLGLDKLRDDDFFVELPKVRVFVPRLDVLAHALDRLLCLVVQVFHDAKDVLVSPDVVHEVKVHRLVVVVVLLHRRRLQTRSVHPPHERRSALEDVST